MRKDMKLGLAVGAIILVAVLSYVLFFAGNRPGEGTVSRRAVSSGAPLGPSSVAQHSRQQGTETGTGQSGDAGLAGGPATRPAQAGAHQPGAGPSASVEYGGPSAWPSTAPARPADQFLVTRTAGWSWQRALEHGLQSDTAATGSSSSTRSESTGPLPARNAASDAGSVSPAGARTYVVQIGETLWSIARREYGNAAYYPHLKRANPQVDPNRLRAGTTIILPPREQVIPAGVQAAPAPSTQPIDPVRQYRVQAGDSLYRICQRLYGGTDQVARLYELNRELIGPNPSALKPNMVLRLPQPPIAAGTQSPSLAGPLQ